MAWRDFPFRCAACTEIRIGSARVSTRGQNLDRQTDMLTAAGCRRIFAGKKIRQDRPAA